MAFGGIDRTAAADYWNHSIGFSGEAAYGVRIATGATLSPVLTLDAGWSGHSGFTEAGAGALNLAAESEGWARLDTDIGLALAYTMPTGSGAVTFEGRALWEHALADMVPSQSLALVGSPAGFTVSGPGTGRDRLRAGAGLSWDVSKGTALRVRYDGLFSSDQANHTASLGLSVGF